MQIAFGQVRRETVKKHSIKNPTGPGAAAVVFLKIDTYGGWVTQPPTFGWLFSLLFVSVLFLP